MLSNHDKNNFPARLFSTPPASWKSQNSPAAVEMPMSERKSNCRRDLFHVVHKVPSGDSPYVRAKHVQLIDKDPSKAISLFWAAINAGDRVDSALKDMAVVMKQLDRSDEAIEAIKSFRHLCAYDSQESLIAREKVQITVEQERSRILGNLAWAYLQHHDYGLAEQHYRKALSVEPDYNKQCNLALCLMHMNKIPEAKSLLQAVSDSCGSTEMDESYAKSFERAVEMLNDLESVSLLKPVEEERENQRSLASPAITGSMDSRRWENGENTTGSHCETGSESQRNFFESNESGPKCISSGLTGSSRSSQRSGVDNGWRRRDRYFESPGERSDYSSKMKENWTGSAGKELGPACKKMLTSPAAVLYTQPRRGSWRFSEGGQRKVRWEEDTVQRPSENVLAHTIRNLDGELQESTDYKSEAALLKSRSSLVSPAERNWRRRPETEVAQVKSTGVAALNQIPQPKIEGHRLRCYSEYDGYAHNVLKHDLQQASWRRHAKGISDPIISETEDQIMLVDEPREFETSICRAEQASAVNVSGKVKSTDSVAHSCLEKNSSVKSASKSWADMAEEEDDLSPYFDSWNYEECTDENLNSNIVHQSLCPKSPTVTISQKLEAFDLRDGSVVSPRNPTVRRSLCFDAKKGPLMRKNNRLQVFRDITPTPDSP
eukprot:XP_015577246.1 uncharacterized protein LOC8265513 [Ricinus communis]